MEYFFIGYLIIIGIALIIGLLSVWTNWISPEDGMAAGTILVILAIFLPMVTEMVISYG